MNGTTFHIKHMVCDRCIRTVRDELTGLGYSVQKIGLGEVTVSEEIPEAGMEEISRVLDENGFELIGDRKGMIINRIKTLIIEYVHYKSDKPGYMNLSEFLAREIGHDYSYLSNLFSSVEGMTIEKYTINQKIEKVKELLAYDELTLNEISYRLGYSSVQHLSGQFKKITGLTPSHFKKIRNNQRTPLDKV